MNPCLTGCRVTGQHKAACEGECRGCLPRAAEHGTLCAWCHTQLTRAVADIPKVVAHLREMAEGAAAASAMPLTDDVIMRGDPAHSTVLHAAWLDADELESIIASWAHIVIEEHPVQPMRGPNSAPWFGDVVAWLTPHLAWVCEQEWAFEMRRDLSDLLGAIRHKFPSAEDVEPVKPLDIPCPGCELVSLIHTPPRYAGQATRVECTDPDCARVFSEDEWDEIRVAAIYGVGKVAA